MHFQRILKYNWYNLLFASCHFIVVGFVSFTGNKRHEVHTDSLCFISPYDQRKSEWIDIPYQTSKESAIFSNNTGRLIGFSIKSLQPQSIASSLSSAEVYADKAMTGISEIILISLVAS